MTSIWRLAFASSIGTTIEWYDFLIYGTGDPEDIHDRRVVPA